MAKKKCNCEKGAPKWMVTFSDMVTLLLVFFVMLMATGEVNVVKTMIVLSAFEGKLGLMQGGMSLSPGEFENMGQNIESLPSSRRGSSLDKAKNRAVSQFQSQIQSKRMRVTEDERGIIISLFTDMLFKPGQAELEYEAVKDILENMRLLIDSLPTSQKIRIEGHTDDLDYEGQDFKDNWDLSAARAWAVLDALKYVPSLSTFREEMVSLVAYAHTRPVVPNTSPENRQQNRRVDIILLREGL